MAAWLAAEGERRTVWLAMVQNLPIGMAPVLEYRRMPRPGRADSRRGCVGTLSARDQFRTPGVGLMLMARVITAAEPRRYARLVLSFGPRATTFDRRAGFNIPDGTAGSQRLLVHPASV